MHVRVHICVCTYMHVYMHKCAHVLVHVHVLQTWHNGSCGTAKVNCVAQMNTLFPCPKSIIIPQTHIELRWTVKERVVTTQVLTMHIAASPTTIAFRVRELLSSLSTNVAHSGTQAPPPPPSSS